jgi:hypothetical protein
MRRNSRRKSGRIELRLGFENTKRPDEEKHELTQNPKSIAALLLLNFHPRASCDQYWLCLATEMDDPALKR